MRRTKERVVTGLAALKAGTTVTIKPTDNETSQLGSGPESIVLKQDGLFHVMRNDRNLDWVDFIVPHYGYCILVKYDSILKIAFSVISWLDVQYLKVLKLGETEKRLLAVLLDVYPSGRCRIEHLNFYNFLTGHDNSLIPFICMLQEPTSAAAKSLRFLKIPSAWYDLYEGSVFAALAGMLQVNRTIEYLEIDMCEILFEEHEAALTEDQRSVHSAPAEPGESTRFPQRGPVLRSFIVNGTTAQKASSSHSSDWNA